MKIFWTPTWKDTEMFGSKLCLWGLHGIVAAAAPSLTKWVTGFIFHLWLESWNETKYCPVLKMPVTMENSVLD